MFSIAKGQVVPRDGSERTNINSKSKEAGMSIKWSVWTPYSAELVSVLLQKCFHVEISMCNSCVLVWGDAGSEGRQQGQGLQWCIIPDTLLWMLPSAAEAGSRARAKPLWRQWQISPTINNLCFKLLEASWNHVEMCLHYGAALAFPAVGWWEGVWWWGPSELQTFCLQPLVQQTLPLVNVVTPQSCLTTAPLCSQKEKSNTTAAFCPGLHCRWHCETKILVTKMCFTAPFQTLIAV